MPDPAVISIDDAASTIGLSVRTVYRLIAAGDFPRQVRLSPKRKGIIRADLDAWLSERRREVSA